MQADRHIDANKVIFRSVMLRRPVAFVAALLFLATPIATIVCEASCAPHAMMSRMGGPHACCPEPARDDGPGILSPVSLCDHSTEAPASTTQSQLVAAAPPPSIAYASTMGLTCTPTAAPLLPAAPDPLALTTQLRI